VRRVPARVPGLGNVTANESASRPDAARAIEGALADAWESGAAVVTPTAAGGSLLSPPAVVVVVVVVVAVAVAVVVVAVAGADVAVGTLALAGSGDEVVATGGALGAVTITLNDAYGVESSSLSCPRQLILYEPTRSTDPDGKLQIRLYGG
jgi:hypothetical protein